MIPISGSILPEINLELSLQNAPLSIFDVHGKKKKKRKRKKQNVIRLAYICRSGRKTCGVGGPLFDRHITGVDQTDTRTERIRNSCLHATLKIRRSLSDDEVGR